MSCGSDYLAAASLTFQCHNCQRARTAARCASSTLLRHPERVREVPAIDDLTRLRLAIRDELVVQYGISGQEVDGRWLDVLTDMVAARVDHSFDVRWAPKWVRSGDPHRWAEGGEYFVECLACGVTTAHPTEDGASGWFDEHRRSHT